MAEHAILISNTLVEATLFENFMTEIGGVLVSDHRWLWELDRGNVWVEHATASIPTYLRNSGNEALNVLGDEGRDLVYITIGRQGASDKVAMEFALRFMSRWNAVLDDDHVAILTRADLEEKLRKDEPLVPI